MMMYAARPPESRIVFRYNDKSLNSNLTNSIIEFWNLKLNPVFDNINFFISNLKI